MLTNTKFFGTDGIRATVGQSPMTPAFVLQLGYAAGQAFKEMSGVAYPRVVIGKDTRVSGPMLEAALVAGLSSAGVNVLRAGVLPTPAVAHIVRTMRLTAGIVVTASHNPHGDNGIKFFSSEGAKLSDAIEARIEALLDEPQECLPSNELGKITAMSESAGRYIEFCKNSFPAHLNLKGLTIALDCAHGAAYTTAPEVFYELGAKVLTMGCEPTGFNINDKCGATHTGALQKFVLDHKADVGIALDGDADRVVMVDSHGQLLDGDALIYLLAKAQHEAGGCKGVAGTIMSNLSLEQALAQWGIPFERTAVGDRHVKEALAQNGWVLGGESSGHVLTLDKHSTGDGIIAALQVLAVLKENKQSLVEAMAGYVPCPQILKSVRMLRKDIDWMNCEELQVVKQGVETQLKGSGRLVLRASGTEPVVRVMVEHPDEHMARALTQRIMQALTHCTQ
jgi:phosphoglucosamine mutase